jgi:hypothetical protein
MQIYRAGAPGTNGLHYGVRALQDVSQGSYICEYVGEVFETLEQTLPVETRDCTCIHSLRDDSGRRGREKEAGLHSYQMMVLGEAAQRYNGIKVDEEARVDHADGREGGGSAKNKSKKKSGNKKKRNRKKGRSDQQQQQQQQQLTGSSSTGTGASMVNYVIDPSRAGNIALQTLY